MTREENTAKLAQLYSEVEALIKDFNEANQEGNYDEAIKADALMTEKIGDYTNIVRNMCFEDCKNSENPMIAAVEKLTFVTIAVKDVDKGEGNEKLIVREMVEGGKERPIDLLKLHSFCGGIGADKNWMHVVQKMNFLLTAQKAKDLGVDPKSVNDSYSMSEIARQFDMGKNPTSNTNMLKTLQMVITAMLGDGYKATSHDVNFLTSIYSKKNRKALTVSCANHSNFRNYIAEICHRIVTGGRYDVDYKKKRAE